MKRFRCFLSVLVLLGLAALAWPQAAGAFPPLPSSVYGRVAVDGVRVPDGTLIEALINDQVYAYTTTLTYEGDSAYSMDIPGDDESTQVIEGGVDGDIIVFRVAGTLADQTATWRSGTNQELDLSFVTQASAATNTPGSQPAPSPTRTNEPGGEEGGSLPTATSQAQPTSAPGDADLVEQAPGENLPAATATFRPGVVEIVDESYPPTATPEASAASADEQDPGAAEAASEPQTGLSLYWVLVPLFFLGVWLFGLWYLKRKARHLGQDRAPKPGEDG